MVWNEKGKLNNIGMKQILMIAEIKTNMRNARRKQYYEANMMKITISINNSKMEGSQNRIIPNISYTRPRTFDIDWKFKNNQ